MKNQNNRVKELEKADMEYNNALYEVYMFKSKAKSRFNEDVMLAKMSNAKRKLAQAKSKILEKL